MFDRAWPHYRPTNYKPVLVTAPTTAVVTVDEAKAHCRVDGTNEDALIGALIAAVVSYLDGWTGILGRCLEAQTWRQDLDCFDRELRLPLSPVISIVSVKYDDVNGVEQTVDPANYKLLEDGAGPFVRFLRAYTFPQTSLEPPAVRVAFLAGYAQAAQASTVPQAIKHAILLTLGHLFENRETVISGRSVAAIELPFAASALLAPFRRMQI